jgi:UDP-3-O-[3-hydroxymyristoyl] glucosamine N-acyltransferase
MNVPLEKHCTGLGQWVRERCHIGTDCITSNAVMEQMDLDFACPERGLVKIPQIGNVIIGNNVEIGANSCVIVENLVLRF